ncbi:unnamed protein product [Ectocarpus sp. 12 AP-2014]
MATMIMKGLAVSAGVTGAAGFVPPSAGRCTAWRGRQVTMNLFNDAARCVPAVLLGVALTTSAPLLDNPATHTHTAVIGASPVFADDKGMSSVSDSKLSVGAASTGDKGARKTVTRGVNIENADYHDKDLSSVSFQQSLVRGTNFKNAKLVAAGFFDADLSNCNFESANMNQANLELANLSGANMKNALVTEAYVSGATKMEPAIIEGADFTDTFLRKDQVRYLCGLDTAKGTNPVSGVDTRDSLGCP